MTVIAHLAALMLTHSNAGLHPDGDIPGIPTVGLDTDPTTSVQVDLAIDLIEQVEPQVAAELRQMRAAGDIVCCPRIQGFGGFHDRDTIAIRCSEGQELTHWDLFWIVLHEYDRMKEADGTGKPNDPRTDPATPGLGGGAQGKDAANINHGKISEAAADLLCQLSCESLVTTIGCEDIKNAYRVARGYYQAAGQAGQANFIKVTAIMLNIEDQCCCVPGYSPL